MTRDRDVVGAVTGFLKRKLKRTVAGDARAALRARVEVLEARVLLTATVYDTAGIARASAATAAGEDALPAPFLPPQHNLQNLNGFLTRAKAGNPLDVAKAYLTSNAASLGLSASDLANYVVTDQYTDADTGVTHLYLRQTLNGLEVTNANLTINVMRDGRILNVAGGFIPDLATTTSTATTVASNAATKSPKGARLAKAAAATSNAAATVTLPTHAAISASQALQHAASSLGLSLSSAPVVRASVPTVGPIAADQVATLTAAHLSAAPGATVLTAPGAASSDVPAHMSYLWTTDGVKLVWNVVIDTADQAHWYDAYVDATGAGGTLLGATDWVEHASYDVWPLPVKSPDDGVRSIVTNPASPTYSPFGWHDTNGVAGAEFTYTRGNNVYAYLDRNADNLPDTPTGTPDGGAGLTFDSTWDSTQAPTTAGNQATAVIQLFYLNNMLHDIHAAYGFTEAAGNFQTKNYSNQGTGNDPVLAEAQDGSGTNNANFATPPDGSSGRMQMYLYTQTTPGRDGDLEADTVVHEYGHGVSNRLTGGPSNASALSATQSGGMGEGWGDWFGLMFTQLATDSKNLGYGHTTYTGGKAASSAGNRHYPYSYNMSINPTTFAFYGNATFGTEVHNSGELWCSALWDMTWLLIDKLGFGTNFAGGYDAATPGKNGGNNLAMKIVEDAMKLQPVNPSFTDARNAIIAADQALNGGQDLLQIWQAFARRGLGYSAVDSGANATTVTTAFDIPPNLQNPRVLSQAPLATATQTSPVSSISFTFSKPMDPASFAVASDVASFTGPGAVDLKSSITGFSWSAGNTVLTVNFAAQATDGQYQMVIGPQILDTSGNPMDQNGNGTTGEATADQYVGKFNYDSVPLQVTATTPAVGSAAAIPLTTFDVTFNEAYDPSTLQAADLTLSTGTVTNVAATGATTARFTVSGLTSEGPLTASIAAGAINDTDGNGMLAFSGTYNLDIGTAAFPALVAVNPLGSLVFNGSTAASIGYAGDVDTYTIALDAGQSITVLATATSGGLTPSIVVKDPGGATLGTATAAAAGQAAVLQALTAAAAGTYTIAVSGAGGTIGGFTLGVTLNAVLEAENVYGPTNDTRQTAQNIDAAFTGLPPFPPSGRSSGRAAVLGTHSPGTSYTPLLSADFESGLNGFTIANGTTNPGMWHQSIGRGSQAGHTATHSLYFGTGETASGGGTYNNGARTTGSVTSPSISIPAGVAATLDFNYVLQTEALSTFDLAQVQISTNGGSSFATLASYNFAAESSVWKAATTISLSSYAGQTVQIRWFFDTVDSASNAFEGWYVDDVKVQVTPPSSDWYAFTLAAGDSASLQLKGLATGTQDLQLYDPAGNLISGSLKGPTNVDLAINDYVAPTGGTYYAYVTGPVGVSYDLLVTKNASFDNEGNDTTSTAQTPQPTPTSLGRRALGHIDSGNVDLYKFTLNAGTTLGASTATPGDGANEPTNLLNPRLRILNAAGTQVAIDDNSGADGKNAVLSYAVTQSGTYYVEVSSTTASATVGDYVLDVTGAQAQPFVVTATTPAAGATVTTSPTAVTVTFNDFVLGSSLQASDLTIDGVAASAVVLNAALNSVTFTPAATLTEGTHTLAIAAGAILDLQQTPLTAYTSNFTYAATAPRVIASTVKQGDALAPGTLTYTATFNKPMQASNLDATDFSLKGALRNVTYAPTSFAFSSGDTVLTIAYAALPEDNYTLTLSSGDGKFEGANTLNLDGEPVWPLPAQGSGNGVEGGDFFVNFTVDTATTAAPVPFVQRAPAGSQIYDQTITTGAINTTTDVDSYTMSLAAGQVLSVVMHATSAGLTPAIELRDAANNSLSSATAPTAGGDAVIQQYAIGTTGTYTIRATSDGSSSGAYTLQPILNATTEDESHGGSANNSTAAAQDLSGSFVNVGGGNGSIASVAGALEAGSGTPSDYYSFYLDPGDTVFLALSRTGTTGGQALTLFDGNGNLVATGGAAVGLERAIKTYTAVDGGTYYARVSGPATPYYLTLTRNVTFDLESNNSLATAQSIVPLSGLVMGALTGTPSTVSGAATLAATADGNVTGTTLNQTSPATFGLVVNASNNTRPVIDFNLSSLPANAVIDSLTLTFQTTAVANSVGTVNVVAFGDDGVITAADGSAAGTQVASYGSVSLGTGSHTIALSSAVLQSLLGTGQSMALRLESGSGDTNTSIGSVENAAVIPAPSLNVTYHLNQTGSVTDADDYYQFVANAGDSVTLTTSTPGWKTAATQFNNTLDPKLELYNAAGTLIASNDNGAGDNRNALIAFTAPSTGVYRVRVTSAAGSVGEYVLVASGISADAPTAPDLVDASDTGSSPTDNVTRFNGSAATGPLQFSVGNTQYGATVIVYANGTEIGRADATGSVTLVTSKSGLSLANGSYAITATQTPSGGSASAASAATTLTVDAAAPTVSSISAPAVSAAGATSYTFTVTFADNNAIDVASLGAGDVKVTGPNAYSAIATLVSVDVAADGTPRTATYSVTPPGGAWDAADAGTYTLALQASQVSDVAGNAAAAGTLGTFTASFGTATPASIAGRMLFYNNSYWTNTAPGASHDLAIDTVKSALRPGQTATAANISAYLNGINGIMLDVANLADRGNLSAADFTFKVGTTGTPATWATLGATATVLVRPGAGAGGSDRVEITFPDGSVTQEWLQVTVKANARTGLTADDVFYFGNLIGDVTGSGAVTSADVGAIKFYAGTTPTASTDYDPNKNGVINSADVGLVKFYAGLGTLSMISV